MPLIVGRRHPVIEIELILAPEWPEFFELGATVSDTEISGKLLQEYILATISETVDEFSYLRSLYGPTISVTALDGQTYYLGLGYTESESIPVGLTWDVLSTATISETGNSLSAIRVNEGISISETIGLGDLLQIRYPGITISETDSLFIWLKILTNLISVSEVDNLFTWLRLITAVNQSESTNIGSVLQDLILGATISETDTSRAVTYSLSGETLSETDGSYAITRLFTGTNASETYSSVMVGLSPGASISTTAGLAGALVTGIHDKIELELVLNRLIDETFEITKEVNLDTHIIS